MFKRRRSAPGHVAVRVCFAAFVMRVAAVAFAAHVVGADRLPKRSREPFSWTAWRDRFNEREFTRRYRLDKDNFARVLKAIRPDIKGQRSDTTPPEVKLACTLRFLAGGSYLDVADIHRVSEAALYSFVHEVIAAINNCPDFDLPLPHLLEDPAERLKPLVAAYNAKSCTGDYPAGCFTGAFGAIDGLCIKIEKPRVAAKPYWCHKGFYSLNCQAICDANHRILWVSVMTVGSTHDSTALNVTQLGRDLRDPAHPLSKTDFFLLGDDAYRGPANRSHGNLITPFNKGCSVEEDAFNYFHSRSRMSIECTFGSLVARWGILWRKVKCDLPHTTAMVECICRLHNVCLNQREPIRSVRSAASREHDGYFEDVPETNATSRDTSEQRAADVKKGVQDTVRQPLVRRLAQQKQTRPRSSKYSYVTGAAADTAQAPSIAAHARAAMNGRQLPADGVAVGL